MNEHTQTATAAEIAAGTAAPGAAIVPLYAALAQAQAEFATIPKNKTNPAFHSKYADLEAILQTVRPVLNRHGIFLYQTTQSDGAFVTVETVLVHASGAELRSGPLTVPVAGRTAQAVGSAITYGKRYSLSGFLGVSADDDDDGNAASEQPARGNPARRLAAPRTNSAAVRPAAPQPKPAAKPAAADEWPETDEDWVARFTGEIGAADSMEKLNAVGRSIAAAGLGAEARATLTGAWKARKERIFAAQEAEGMADEN